MILENVGVQQKGAGSRRNGESRDTRGGWWNTAHRVMIFGSSSVKDNNSCFKVLLRVQAGQQWWRIQTGPA